MLIGLRCIPNGTHTRPLLSGFGPCFKTYQKRWCRILSDEYLVNCNWILYKVYDEQRKNNANRSICLAASSIFHIPNTLQMLIFYIGLIYMHMYILCVISLIEIKIIIIKNGFLASAIVCVSVSVIVRSSCFTRWLSNAFSGNYKVLCEF